jgi:hypothetical protein
MNNQSNYIISVNVRVYYNIKTLIFLSKGYKLIINEVDFIAMEVEQSIKDACLGPIILGL